MAEPAVLLDPAGRDRRAVSTARPARRDAEALERRCRLLLRAYPASYRAERGDEIVATVLDTTPSARRWPTAADALDLLAGGLRRRFGLIGVTGLDEGLRLAAPVALALAAGISGFAWWRLETVEDPDGGPALLGVFRTTGPVAYLCWLLAALAWLHPRLLVRRLMVGLAIVATMALPLVDPIVPVPRPPLWTVMSLAAFGLITMVGAVSGRSATLDTRSVVPVGAIAVAVVTHVLSTVDLFAQLASRVTRARSVGIYYQPSIAWIGLLVTFTVAVVAACAVVRRLRGGRASPLLWTAAVLALPAGWLGPYGSGNGFGRLAQVLLATCVATGTLAWLLRHTSLRPAPTPAALRTVGAVALGAGLGLGAFLAGAQVGLFGPTGTVGPTGVVGSSGVVGLGWGAAGIIPVAVLLCTGVVGVTAGVGPLRRAVAACAMVGLAAFALAWVVVFHDYDWMARDWGDFSRTGGLVVTVAILPLAACAYVGGRLLASRPLWTVRLASAVWLVGGGGWIGYLALPHLWLWAPGMLALALCRLAEVLPPSRGAAARP